MNRIYSVIWSYTKECYVVASELASQKGRASRRGRFKLSFFLLLFSFLFGSPSLSGEIEAGNNYMSANMLEDGSFPSSNLEQISSVNDDAEKKNTKQKEVFLNGVDSHRNNSFVLSPFISNRALAPDDIAIVIGKGAVGAELQGVVAIGDNAVTDNQGGIAIGHSAKATEGSISIGWNAQTATRSVSIGDNSAATGILATSLGPYAKANSENSVAIGNASEANEELVVSFGNNALKRKVINIAAGDISDNSTDAINGSQLYVTNKRVEKSESDITTIKTNITNIENKVSTGSLGLLQLSADKRSLVIDNAVANVADTFTLAKKDGTGRTLTGVLRGKADLDAVNVSQLKDVTNALGGGAEVNVDGSIKAPTYNVGDKEVSSVGDAITNIDQSITNINKGEVGLVKLADDRIILDNKIASGADTFDFSNKDESDNPVARKLTGVAAGGIASTSLDAINGSQLYTANSNVAKTLGGDAKLDEDGQLTGVNFQEALGADNSIEDVNTGFAHVKGELDTTNKNVTNVTAALGGLETDGTWKLELGKDGNKITANNVKDAFKNIDDRVIDNSQSITNIENKVSTGSLGLLQLSADKRSLVIDNAVANVADTFTLATKDGKGRTLTGVSAGKIADDSLDAINGSQLYATHQNITNIDNRVAKNEGNIVNLQDQVANITNNTGNSLEGIADALGGGAIFSKEGVLQDVNFADALNASEPITSVNEGFEHITGRLDGQDKQLNDHENRITNIEGNISNIADGKAGLIQVSEDGNSLIIDNELAKNASTFDISNGDKDLILTGVKDGQISSESKDAINGSQLYASNQSIAEMFGGGATIDADGYITTPEYVIGDKTFNNVGASIEHLANSITAGEVGIFQLDREKNQIIIADNTDINSETTLNVGNRKIVGVANGKVEKGSQEVVNGGQLWETNQQVTSNSNQIKHINKTLDHYNHRISNLEKTVHENRKRASAGTASAMAMSSIPYMDYAKYSMGMGVASYDGEAAMSIGMEFKLGDNGRFRVQGSYDTQNKAGVGVGIAFSF